MFDIKGGGRVVIPLLGNILPLLGACTDPLTNASVRRVHGTTGQAKDTLLYFALFKYYKIEFFTYFIY
jgi:hypothetical protein